MRAAAVGLVVAVMMARGATAGDVETEIARLDAARRGAMVQADSTVLDALLAEGCVYTHSTGLVQTKAEFIAMLVSGDVDYVSFDVADEDVHPYAGTAVVTGRQVIELVVRGKPVRSVSRFTVVWARITNDWECVAYQSTSIPEAKEGE
jgi:hypothetical protein